MESKKELIHYIDWELLSEDYNLESGECPPDLHFAIEDLLEKFIRINK